MPVILATQEAKAGGVRLKGNLAGGRGGSKTLSLSLSLSLCLLAVLGLELRAYTLSHSTCSFL
jgi:hypothetical protein